MEKPVSAETQKFSVFDHPLLPQRIFSIPIFSWPTFLIGPIWFLWKRLWVPAVVAMVGTAVLFLFLSYVGLLDRQVCSTEYLGVCDTEENLWVPFLVQIVINLFCAAVANVLWSNDLLRRGYVISEIVEAKSLDHARAIMARSGILKTTLPAGGKR
jgi:hypothetical protein